MKYLYKSLPRNLTPHGHKFKVGNWYKVKGALNICHNGFHASRNIIDAMQYVDAGCLAKVEVRGASIKQKYKECWEEMRLVKVYRWTKQDSVSLAVFAAELILEHFEKDYPYDLLPRLAINAAKAVLKNDDASNRRAAHAAAHAAMSAASGKEWVAARVAAHTAMSAVSAVSENKEKYNAVLTQCHDFVIKQSEL